MTRKQMVEEMVNEYVAGKTQLSIINRINLKEHTTRRILNRCNKEWIEYVYSFYKKEQSQGNAHINYLIYKLTD